jgi:hypothetical protein
LAEDHQIGDVVHYRSDYSNKPQKGKVVEIGQGQLKVHRRGEHGGKYGYHYIIPKSAVIHNERTGHVKEEVVNEISIQTASKALRARMRRSQEDLARSEQPAGPFWKKAFAKSALKHFNKAQDTARRIGKKVDAADAASRAKEQAKKSVKEEVIQEDAISHLKKVVAFKTSTPLYHKNGTQTKLDPQTANALLTVHGSLHPDNQKKFNDSCEHSKEGLAKMIDFAWKQVK